MTPQSVRWMDLARAWEAGIPIVAGGVDDQPTRDLEGLRLVLGIESGLMNK